MLGEYRVSRPTRQCHVLGRPLRPGEWYFSVLIEHDEDFIRRDISAEAWTEPPAGTVGHWKKRMPQAGKRKLVLAAPEVLINLLEQLEHHPDNSKCRYLLALMLMRRKIVARSAIQPDEGTFRVEGITDQRVIDVPVARIEQDETEALTAQLNDWLYCEAEPEANAESDGDRS